MDDEPEDEQREGLPVSRSDGLEPGDGQRERDGEHVDDEHRDDDPARRPPEAPAPRVEPAPHGGPARCVLGNTGGAGRLGALAPASRVTPGARTPTVLGRDPGVRHGAYRPLGACWSGRGSERGPGVAGTPRGFTRRHDV
ncbi:hypothetical protein GCM10023203_29780 [Actinomycetospora straminea]|uniref:Uncharacterized protein n=1 Tax=Actinomycetospora straminea TaxID=663607 RepID=A0ABP9EKI4_9PSEU